jgi:hypothetical protein
LLDPLHIFAHMVTIGSSLSFPIAQSVTFAQAPAAVAHVPPSSAGGLPPLPGAPPDPVVVLDPLVVDAPPDPGSPVVEEVEAAVVAVFDAAVVLDVDTPPGPVVDDAPPPFSPPPHARSAAASTKHRPPGLWLDMSPSSCGTRLTACDRAAALPDRVNPKVSSLRSPCAVCRRAESFAFSIRRRRSAGELRSRSDAELLEDAPNLIGDSAERGSPNASNLLVRFAAK